MIKPIDSCSGNVNFGGNVKLASSKTLARLHYIKFLKAEDEFMNTSEVFENQTSDLYLKTITTFAKAVKNFGKMAYERIASAYYYKKN